MLESIPAFVIGNYHQTECHLVNVPNNFWWHVSYGYSEPVSSFLSSNNINAAINYYSHPLLLLTIPHQYSDISGKPPPTSPSAPHDSNMLLVVTSGKSLSTILSWHYLWELGIIGSLARLYITYTNGSPELWAISKLYQDDNLCGREKVLMNPIGWTRLTSKIS